MYCPNCKQEYEGKFCPECGTKLIEKPASQAGGINLNLGDANAISGGLNITDSHDVHNINNSVHNTNNNTTNNITNITNIAAQKTEIEVLQERKIEFMAVVNAAFSDGVLDQEEQILLEKERIRIGLDAVTAKNLIDSVRRNIARSNKQALTPMQQIMLKQIRQLIEQNDVEGVTRQLSRLEGIAKNCIEEDVKFLYFLSAAAVNPEKLINDFESAVCDEYWNTYWVYIAYTKKNNDKSAEDVLNALSLYGNYPKDNIVLLSAVAALREFGADTAQKYLDALTGDLSDLLTKFAGALYLLVEPDIAADFRATEQNCAFYLKNILQFEDDAARAQREANEQAQLEAEANRKYNMRLVSLGGNSFKISMLLKSGLGISLSDAKALIDSCPIDIMKCATRVEMSDLFENLKKAGANVVIL